MWFQSLKKQALTGAELDSKYHFGRRNSKFLKIIDLFSFCLYAQKSSEKCLFFSNFSLFWKRELPIYSFSLDLFSESYEVDQKSIKQYLFWENYFQLLRPSSVSCSTNICQSLPGSIVFWKIESFKRNQILILSAGCKSYSGGNQCLIPRVDQFLSFLNK